MRTSHTARNPVGHCAFALFLIFSTSSIRIYHNIVKLIASPNDRILVIYGPVTSDGYSRTLPMLR